MIFYNKPFILKLIILWGTPLFFIGIPIITPFIHMKSTPHDLNITPCQHLNKDILIDMKVD